VKTITYLFVGWLFYWIFAKLRWGYWVVTLLFELKSVAKINLRPASLAKERVSSWPNIAFTDYYSVILIWMSRI